MSSLLDNDYATAESGSSDTLLPPSGTPLSPVVHTESTADTTTSESSRGIHRVSTLMRCPRAYGYNYLLGLMTRTEKDALALGTLVHLGIEAWFRGENWNAPILDAPERLAHMAVKALQVVQGYTRKWTRERPEQIVSQEKEYELMICGEELLTRRIDRLIRTADHRLVAYDIKTASRVAERTRKTVLDPTLFTQEMVGRWSIAPSMGLKWGGVVLDLVPTVGWDDPDNFVRQPLTYGREMLRTAETSLLYWMRQEREITDEYRDGRLDPWKLAQSFQCYPSGFMCDYWWLCNGGEIELSRYERRTDR